MKKKMLITALALGTGTMMLAASVQAATAEEIMEKYMEASQNAAAFSADVDMNLAIGLGITMEGVSMNMDMALLGDLAMDYIKDPLSMQLDGSMSITIPGEEEESVALQLYMVPEEGARRLRIRRSSCMDPRRLHCKKLPLRFHLPDTEQCRTFPEHC